MSDIVVIPQPQPFAIPVAYGTAGGKGDPGSPGEGYATRAAMAARLTPALLDDVYLTEAGREGKFVVDLASSWTAAIAADTGQALFVPSTADATKVYRRVTDRGDAKWSGAKGDDPTTNDQPAIQSGFALATAMALTGYGYGAGGGRFHIGKALYRLDDALSITSSMRLDADGCGGAGGLTTILHAAVDKSALINQYYNTVGDTGTYTPVGPEIGGQGSVITGFGFLGRFNGTTVNDNTNAPLVRLRGNASLRDFQAWKSQGPAIWIDAGFDLAEQGNANGFELTKGFIQECLVGVRIGPGADTNVGLISALEVVNVRTWAFEDHSIGATYMNCIAQGCGVYGDGTAGSPCCAVANGLGQLFSVRSGRESVASTTAPPTTATSDLNYIYWIPGSPGAIPLWTTGIHLRAGGSFFTVSGGCLAFNYDEGGLPAQVGGNTLVLQHTSDTPPVGGGHLSAGDNQILVNGLRITGSYGAGGTMQIDNDIGGIVLVGRLNPGNPNAFIEPDALASGLALFSPDRGTSVVISNGEVDVGSVAIRSTYLRPVADNAVTLGGSGHRYVELWAASATIQTSDRDHKTAVRPLSDSQFDVLLDAVGAVPLVAFKFKDAVAKKGKRARDHYGIIAQDLHDELVKRGLDPFVGGVLGRDQAFEDVEEEVEVEREAMRSEGLWRDQIEMVDGKAVLKKVYVERQVPAFDEVPVHDEDGKPIVSPARQAHKRMAMVDGEMQLVDVPARPEKPKIHKVRRMERVTETRTVPKPKLGNDGEPEMIWSVRYSELAALQFAWMQRELRKTGA